MHDESARSLREKAEEAERKLRELAEQQEEVRREAALLREAAAREDAKSRRAGKRPVEQILAPAKSPNRAALPVRAVSAESSASRRQPVVELDEDDDDDDDDEHGEAPPPKRASQATRRPPVSAAAESADTESDDEENSQPSNLQAGAAKLAAASQRLAARAKDPLHEVLSRPVPLPPAAPKRSRVTDGTVGGGSDMQQPQWTHEDDLDEVEDDDNGDGGRLQLPAQPSTKRRALPSRLSVDSAAGDAGSNAGPSSSRDGTGSGASTARGGVKRTKRVKFTAEEEEQLRQGHARFDGVAAKWQEILKHFTFHPSRTGVDLKDKWRNMQKAGTA
jgi:hypothetical protein